MEIDVQTSERSRLRNGMKVFIPALGTAAAFSLFINLLAFVSPLYMLQIYDRVISSKNEMTLVALTLIAGYLLLILALLEMLRSRVMIKVGISFDRKVASLVYNAIHRASLKWPSLAQAQALRDVDTIREFMAGPGLMAACDLPWIPIFVAVCFVFHPAFGWIAIIGAIIITMLTIVSEMATTAALGRAAKASGNAAQSAATGLRNVEVLQAMGMLSAVRGRWLKHHDAALRFQTNAAQVLGLLVASSKFVRMFLQTLILGTGAYLAIHRQISPGSIVAASIIIGRALAPVEGIVGNWKGITGARQAYRRVEKLLLVAGEERRPMELPRPLGSLHLEDVSVSPPGQTRLVIEDVNMTVLPGEVVGIIGPSAAGKSSIARAMMGVWPCATGVVRMDGSDIAHWNAQDLGRYMGYLPQDIELFAGTIAQNIARFQPIDSEAIVEIAMLCGCHEMIQQMPEGYDTQIGEGGMALSGGQRQRVGLARAFYGRPALVVLDEPNASLDSAGEEALVAAIKRFSSFGTTVILISHKLNILSVTDKVLLLQTGQVQAFGRREEVLGRITTPRVVAA